MNTPAPRPTAAAADTAACEPRNETYNWWLATEGARVRRSPPAGCPCTSSKNLHRSPALLIKKRTSSADAHACCVCDRYHGKVNKGPIPDAKNTTTHWAAVPAQPSHQGISESTYDATKRVQAKPTFVPKTPCGATRRPLRQRKKAASYTQA